MLGSKDRGRAAKLSDIGKVSPGTCDSREAQCLGAITATEASSIEARFSRYQPDGVVASPNAGAGNPVEAHPVSAPGLHSPITGNRYRWDLS